MNVNKYGLIIKVLVYMASKNLSVEHIQYATNIQLSKLLDKDPSTTSHWLKRNFRLETLDIHYSCIDHLTLVTGLMKRKADSQKAKKLQKEFDEILNASDKLDVTISA